MKLFFTLAFALVILAASGFRATFGPDKEVTAPNLISGLEDVIKALKTGNATELSKYVDDNIEISLPDKSDSYSRAQAVMILQDFFTTNGVKGFTLTHKGDNGGSQFCIGTLQTRSGNYRTTVFMKTKNGRQLVKEIRFQSI